MVKRRVKHKNADLGAPKTKRLRAQMSRPLGHNKRIFFNDFDLNFRQSELDRWPVLASLRPRCRLVGPMLSLEQTDRPPQCRMTDQPPLGRRQWHSIHCARQSTSAEPANSCPADCRPIGWNT